ncbi:hypothetical protein ACFOWB_16040 [Chenggangzhangella methanolivorans]|uniref:hypothetical protein n=1 Tax=Chenggangzhangella methanolivorans TaxID=1437009 RepID=UPI00361EA57C
MTRLRLAVTMLLCSAGAAAAQSGDAAFCRSYAATTAVVAEDAIRIDGACQDFSKGVHGIEKMHRDWCMRTAQSEVEGAATYIRRLASQCVKGRLARPTDYGGYDIAGNEAFERSYGEARGWQVTSAFSGRTFMYCAATKDVGRGDVRLGRDLVEPGASGQWRLAVPVASKPDWRGALEIDGRGSGHGGGESVGGAARDGWTIAWLSMSDVEALRQGKAARLNAGAAGFEFALDGAAAALLKVEECVARKGGAPVASPTQASGASVGPEIAAKGAVAHSFEAQIFMSAKAQARLKKIGEKVKVAAYYSGEPVPSKRKLANEVGEISLGDEEVVLPPEGGAARMKGEMPAKKIGWVKEPMVLLNIFSARLAHQDNLLNCGIFQDSIKRAQTQPIVITCKLIDEG